MDVPPFSKASLSPHEAAALLAWVRPGKEKFRPTEDTAVADTNPDARFDRTPPKDSWILDVFTCSTTSAASQTSGKIARFGR